jgi:hypothetical protein
MLNLQWQTSRSSKIGALALVSQHSLVVVLLVRLLRHIAPTSTITSNCERSKRQTPPKRRGLSLLYYVYELLADEI